MSAGAKEHRQDRRVAVVFSSLLFVLFWLGRSHSYGPGDSAQHVICGLLWGVPHPPGYPLQTALAWAWSRLGWADAGAAINGLSGLFAAASAGVLFLLLRRRSCRLSAALSGAVLMALSPLFWYYSLVAEVRALNGLLALACALLAADWARGASPRSLGVFAFVFGLGLSHHPTFILLSPAYVIWLSARRPPPRQAGSALLLAFCGLALPYLLLGLRLAHSLPAYDLFEVRGWGDLLPLYLRKGLGGPLRAVAGAGMLGSGRFDLGRLGLHAGWFLSSLWTHAGIAGLVLAAGGTASLWRRDRRELSAWALWAAASAGAFILLGSQQYAGQDAYTRAVAVRFHLLPLIAVFALAGYGAEALARRVRPLFMTVLAASLILAPLTLRRLSMSHSDPLLEYARAWIRDSEPGDIVVLGSDDTIFAAWDLELVRRESAGRAFLIPSMFAFPPYIRSLQARYPGLSLPRDGDGRLTTDWGAWLLLNPGSAVLLEPSLLGAALKDSPHVTAQGSLLRARADAARTDPAADARRFLDAPETGSVSLQSVRSWTQEVYLLESRSLMARWLLSRLDSGKDGAEAERLRALVGSLSLD
ncbi:MAG: hypothetical protein A2506_06080 [Elusimicrobia bacterium RIFOXYD12_FULL_66_9]|nr:MAG: hypothetical protein A2506_06080 [Elusimicrobia bacterium RIFOXYD12_FULL_66_9]